VYWWLLKTKTRDGAATAQEVAQGRAFSSPPQMRPRPIDPVGAADGFAITDLPPENDHLHMMLSSSVQVPAGDGTPSMNL
jgi:hypothetical protein